MHNLTRTLALISLLAPASGYSLGIGDIKLHSALNQNLDAEISLVTATGDKVSDIKVNLAPPDKFDEAGVPWASFLSRIKFETATGANGSVIIKLNSKEAVTEPFLNFLLQVSWPKGILYREFTVLLDPPAAYIPHSSNAENYTSEPSTIPSYKFLPTPQTRVERQLSKAGEYGPTTKNDTLWKIAEQAGKQSGVSVEQMMIALYEENPQAFYRGNVNGLFYGKILKIPERVMALKLSREQALTEFNRHTKAWKNQVEPPPVITESIKKESPDKQLTLVAPIQTDVTKNEPIALENEQTIVHATEPKAVDKEIVSATSPVNDALLDKVATLEKQLAIMQQILVLKDQQLAALQNQSQSKPVVQTESATPTPSQSAVINPFTQPVIQAQPEAATSGTHYYLWSGVSATLLALLGWFGWRKRKNNKQFFASLIGSNTHEPTDFFSTSSEKESAKEHDVTDKNTTLNGFTIGDLDTDTGQSETDLVAEADLYLAYGRYQEAEELLREVLKDQPNHDDCKLKLLNIYYLSKNKTAFEAYAYELAKAGKNDDIQFWSKVSEMGHEISTNSTLFFSKVDASSPKETISVEKKPEKLVEFDTIKKDQVADSKPSSFGESLAIEVIKEDPKTTDSLLDFDLVPSETYAINEQQNNGSIDFELSAPKPNIEISSDALSDIVFKTPELEIKNQFESLAFESNETKTLKTDEINNAATKSTVENTPFIDKQTDESSALNNILSIDSLDIDFFLDKPALGLQGKEIDRTLDVFDLTDRDEMETKLDLIKAYIDMNDEETAKKLSCEVLEKGSTEQQKIAQALLDELK
ncbi:MAG: FimV/HubP family polar landmark protein [Methylococcaceae bacterium]